MSKNLQSNVIFDTILEEGFGHSKGVSSVTNISQESDSTVGEISENVTKKRNQTLILILFTYANFCVYACVSLQTPFFPKEAESKGATPSQYGLVLGVYQLVIMITSPIFGKITGRVSPILLTEVGLIITGISTVVFGLLDRVPFGTPFIISCFVVRIIEAISASAFLSASYALVVQEFPDRIGTAFGLMETACGLGYVLGPPVGEALYELGGFELPFVTLGMFLLLGGVLTCISMPKTSNKLNHNSGNLFKFLSDVGVILDFLAIVSAMNLFGYNNVTLEPHLRRFALKPIIIGLVITITGIIYCLTSLFWGKLCDIGIDPKKLCLIGYIICIIGITFIGPLDLIPFEPQLWIVIMSLMAIGFGNASLMVCAFTNSLHDSIKRRGFADDISTYGLVSAMFFVAQSLGGFIGPSIGGILKDHIGYRKGNEVILSIEIVMLLLHSFYCLVMIKNYDTEEVKPLLNTH